MTITDFGVAIVNGDSHLSKWILEHRRLDVDGSAYEVATRFIKQGDVVVDGGACLGDHTIVYLDAVGETGVVHAFEPNPIAFECLAYNCRRAILHQQALGRYPGYGFISMGDHLGNPPHTNLGAAVVIPKQDGGRVRIETLDRLNLARLNFLKLDLEGMELDALMGATETLHRCHPVVMVEINTQIMRAKDVSKIYELMACLGYAMQFRDPRYGAGEAADVIFTP